MSGRRWRACRACGVKLDSELWRAQRMVCARCGYHDRIAAAARIAAVTDPNSFCEYDRELRSQDPLAWDAGGQNYGAMLSEAEAKTGSAESFLYGAATLMGRPIWIGAFEFAFLGGTLGTVAGEKLARMLEAARETRHPAVVFTASGGARMQEGMLSLMQMAKIATVIAALTEARVPLITVITDPTTGGVAASLAFMGDAVLAEPGALVGFAGPRVILQTIGEEMPEGVQTSDRLCADGFVDEIVARSELRTRLAAWLDALCGPVAPV